MKKDNINPWSKIKRRVGTLIVVTILVTAIFVMPLNATDLFQYIDTGTYAGMGGYTPRFFYDTNVDLSYEDTSSGEYSFAYLSTYPYTNKLENGEISTSILYPFADNSEHGFYNPTDIACNLVNIEAIYYSLDISDNINRSYGLVEDNQTTVDALYGYSAGCSFTIVNEDFEAISPTVTNAKTNPIIEFGIQYRTEGSQTWTNMQFDTISSPYVTINEYYYETDGYAINYNVSFSFTPDLAELGKQVHLKWFCIYPFESGSFSSTNIDISYIFLNRVDIFSNWTYKTNPFVPKHEFDSISDVFHYEGEINDNIPNIDVSDISDVIDSNAFKSYATIMRQPLENQVIAAVLTISITFMIAGFLIYGKRVK